MPTDWERNVAALESSAWITADIAYRRAVLEAVGGFDERFPRAYREDTDLALQVLALGSSIVRGRRCTEHPVPRADWSVSVHKQAGNADDALLRHRYGRDWRRRACAPRGRFPAHALAVALATSAVLGALARRPRVAVAAALGWAGATVEFAWSRSRRTARSPLHVATMLLTSAAIPFAAVFHRLRGEGRVLIDARRGLAPTTRLQRRVPVRAVLLDRDGTLVHDVPYNGNPALVDPVPGAPVALERLRTAGLRLAVVTNQSGIARGTVTADDVAAVNARVDALLGPIEHWAVCPHGPDDGCACRKPAAGLVLEAAARLGVAPQECVVIGDTGADVDAALAAGARAILVPNTATRAEEVALAPRVAPDLAAAVDLVVGS